MREALIPAKKHFGQHFLVNQGVIERIANQVARYAEKSNSNLEVIEVGPGKGALTEELLKRKLCVLAIEVDSDMVEFLEEKFHEAIGLGRLKLLKKDVLKVENEDLGEGQVICGNLPYNIGSAVVTKALKEWDRLKFFCFMLQKEVVEKFISESGRDYGPLSVRMAWMAKVEGHFWVKPGSFSPPPKVDSGVFWFQRLDKTEQPVDLELRMKIIDELFSKRRKMIRASRKDLKESPWAELRPEQLLPRDFVALTDLCLGRVHE